MIDYDYISQDKTGSKAKFDSALHSFYSLHILLSPKGRSRPTSYDVAIAFGRRCPAIRILPWIFAFLFKNNNQLRLFIYRGICLHVREIESTTIFKENTLTEEMV